MGSYLSMGHNLSRGHYYFASIETVFIHLHTITLHTIILWTLNFYYYTVTPTWWVCKCVNGFDYYPMGFNWAWGFIVCYRVAIGHNLMHGAQFDAWGTIHRNAVIPYNILYMMWSIPVQWGDDVMWSDLTCHTSLQPNIMHTLWHNLFTCIYTCIICVLIAC